MIYSFLRFLFRTTIFCFISFLFFALFIIVNSITGLPIFSCAVILFAGFTILQAMTLLYCWREEKEAQAMRCFYCNEILTKKQAWNPRKSKDTEVITYSCIACFQKNRAEHMRSHKTHLKIV